MCLPHFGWEKGIKCYFSKIQNRSQKIDIALKLCTIVEPNAALFLMAQNINPNGYLVTETF